MHFKNEQIRQPEVGLSWLQNTHFFSHIVYFSLSRNANDSEFSRWFIILKPKYRWRSEIERVIGFWDNHSNGSALIRFPSFYLPFNYQSFDYTHILCVVCAFFVRCIKWLNRSLFEWANVMNYDGRVSLSAFLQNVKETKR